jgi:hypothetical protein
MGEAVGIFIAGIAGVFAGMSLLYGAIKLTTLLIERYCAGWNAK